MTTATSYNNQDRRLSIRLVEIGKIKGGKKSPPSIEEEHKLERTGARYLHSVLKKPCCAQGIEERQLYDRLERIGINRTWAKNMLDDIIERDLFVITETGEGYDGLEGFNLQRSERKGKTYYHRKDKI